MRLGYKTRDEAIELVRKYDHVKARKSLNYFLDMTNMKENEFDGIADSFRDPRVWWIKNGEWWKDNIWGEPSAYGEVYLPMEQRYKYSKI